MMEKRSFCRRLTAAVAAGFAVAALLLMHADSARCQVHAGAAFLKQTPGARAEGLAGSLAGALDLSDAIYANPGATGYLREWHWSASYVKWITDTYNASVMHSRRFSTFFATPTQFALSASYLGIPDFDSSERAAVAASASDLLLALSIGQPIDAFNRRVALGANIKYLSSRLDHFRASGLIVDFGLQYRSPRFRLPAWGGVFDYGILSAGVAVSQIGQSLSYLGTDTPLPLTRRAGMAINLGKHEGMQLQLASDYRHIRDEGGTASLGAEISWRQLIGLRGGYLFQDNLFGGYSFGASLRLDDQLTALKNLLPGRSAALQLDVSALQTGDFVDRPYRGSAGSLPIGPERFAFLEPDFNAEIVTDSITFAWQASRDPDLYDDVHYSLIIGQDSLALLQYIDALGTAPAHLRSQPATAGLLLHAQLAGTAYTLHAPHAGDHFWAVLAIDRDGHLRMAERDGRLIEKFRVVQPDIQITEFTFTPSEWITTGPEQGTLEIALRNNGRRSVRSGRLMIIDSLEAGPHHWLSNGHDGASVEIASLPIDYLQPGEMRRLRTPWHTDMPGRHRLEAIAELSGEVQDANVDDNRLAASFYTIPKGTVTAPDSAVAITYSRVTYDLPFIAEVYFDSASTSIPAEYIRRWELEPPLKTLLKRLQSYEDVQITVKGFADPNSQETSQLQADARARAVRDSLLELGLQPEQIILLEGEVRDPRRVPQDPDDASWIFQERRNVKIFADRRYESQLFQPVTYTDDLPKPQPVPFSLSVQSAVPIDTARLHLQAGAATADASLAANLAGDLLAGDFDWMIPAPQQVEAWLEKPAAYSISLLDSLGRRFRTQPATVFLQSPQHFKEHRISWPLKFDSTDPFYDFYWERLFGQIHRMLEHPKMRVRFVGHACAIGPDDVNLRLSQKRARVFHDNFLRMVKQEHPGSYQRILARLDPAIGYGEQRPFTVLRPDGQVVVIGDNNSPLGRVLNRRIEILFYFPEK